MVIPHAYIIGIAPLLKNAVFISWEHTTVCTYSPIDKKEPLQKLVFPEGIYYNLGKVTFRTGKVNEAFRLFASLNCITEENKKGKDSISAILSSQVGATGHISNFLMADLIRIDSFHQQSAQKLLAMK